MLLKYTSYHKRTKLTASGKPQRSTGNVKATNGKGYRKAVKGAGSKRIKNIPAKRDEIPISVDPCENSNDSGLGFDHHLDYQVPRTSSFIEQEYSWNEIEAKRQRLDIKVECDNANDNFTFSQARVQPGPSSVPICSRPSKNVSAGKGKRSSPAVNGQSVGFSRDGKVQLQIISQPEMQHRARYQTEGSRGAVKDRSGNSFPIVRLIGYHKSTKLEVYIGTDQGRVAPHMFYQACRVSGKNSTPCLEKKVNGTVIIEIELDPSKEMTATCDCVGILKERNVDVEHRFPEESTSRSKKKSTRCRMVFRTVITHSDNSIETLQVTSQPIICTQPPGVPEICKKSLSSCPVTGNIELFILGKNFLKDTKVTFSEGEIGENNYWEAVVTPDKEFLQQSHLICSIPPYKQEIIDAPVPVRLNIVSSSRSSEAHLFMYTQSGTPPMQAITQENMVNRAIAPSMASPPAFPGQNMVLGIPLMMPPRVPLPTAYMSEMDTVPEEKDDKIAPILMPPPSLPVTARRGSQPMLITEPPIELKREAESPPEEPLTPGSELATSQPLSMATLRQFVSTPNTPLPSLSVETYFSRIENKTISTTSMMPMAMPIKTMYQNPMNSILSPQDQIGLRPQEKLDFNDNCQPCPEKLSTNEMMDTLPHMPVQTSPLNLNTNEIQHASNIPKLLPPICNILSQEPPLTTSILTPILTSTLADTSNLILSSPFSQNKDIVTDMTSNYNEMATSVQPQFSPNPELVKDVISPHNSNMLISPEYTSTEALTNSQYQNEINNFVQKDDKIQELPSMNLFPKMSQISEPFGVSQPQQPAISESFAISGAQQPPISESFAINGAQQSPSSESFTINGAQQPPISESFAISAAQQPPISESFGMSQPQQPVMVESFSISVPQQTSISGSFGLSQNFDGPKNSIENNISVKIKASVSNMIIEQSTTKKVEVKSEPLLTQELTQMSEHDLLSYINPSCFDQV